MFDFYCSRPIGISKNGNEKTAYLLADIRLMVSILLCKNTPLVYLRKIWVLVHYQKNLLEEMEIDWHDSTKYSNLFNDVYNSIFLYYFTVLVALEYYDAACFWFKDNHATGSFKVANYCGDIVWRLSMVFSIWR